MRAAPEEDTHCLEEEGLLQHFEVQGKGRLPYKLQGFKGICRANTFWETHLDRAIIYSRASDFSNLGLDFVTGLGTSSG